MKTYLFRDTDKDGFAEYDIAGEDYKRLIRRCCQYCTEISFEIYPESQPKLLPLLQSYELVGKAHPSRDLFVSSDHASPIPFTVRYYRICPEVCEILLRMDSIFQWIWGWGYENPENPTFYRKDGSVFFDSVIHDGICFLHPRPDEDVTDLLSSPL